MPSSKEMSGVDPPGEGHSRYDQIGAHVLHGVVMRAQTVTLTLRSWFGPGSTRCLLPALLPSPMGGYP